MNNIEMKRRVLWHLMMSIMLAHHAAVRYLDINNMIRLQAHGELSGQFAMAYYLNVIPENIKSAHTYAMPATVAEYRAMYNDILSLYVECGGDSEFAPKL